MNKLTKIILIVLILLISNTIFSSDFTYGVKIGGTYSNADVYRSIESTDKFTNNYYYWGTFFSFYGNKNFYKIMDLQLEANYNQRGVKYHDNENNTTYTTIPSLELVSLLKLNMDYFILYIGVFGSWSFYDKIESSSPDSSPYTGGGGITLDYGYTLGGELKYKKYLIDFRYNQGFDNFIDYAGGESRHYSNSKQFVLSLGYEF
jgi:hypothetical protein